jgi:hypothetical protein
VEAPSSCSSGRDRNSPVGGSRRNLPKAGSEAPERALQWNPGRVPEGEVPGRNVISEQMRPEGRTRRRSAPVRNNPNEGPIGAPRRMLSTVQRSGCSRRRIAGESSASSQQILSRQRGSHRIRPCHPTNRVMESGESGAATVSPPRLHPACVESGQSSRKQKRKIQSGVSSSPMRGVRPVESRGASTVARGGLPPLDPCGAEQKMEPTVGGARQVRHAPEGAYRADARCGCASRKETPRTTITRRLHPERTSPLAGPPPSNARLEAPDRRDASDGASRCAGPSSVRHRVATAAQSALQNPLGQWG